MKLIIFDLDGVLLDAKNIHYEALNDALFEVGAGKITRENHLGKFDGLTTKDKLKLLTQSGELAEGIHQDVWRKKQDYTMSRLNEVCEDDAMIACLSELKLQGFLLACCSNSIKSTVQVALNRLGIYKYFDLIISNEDVKSPKPHPETYWRAMIELQAKPQETLIIEDSPNGLLAAEHSGAYVMRVESPKSVTAQNILKHISTNCRDNKAQWRGNSLNVLIPMAGAGRRFAEAGYKLPKPLIDVNGTPMIELVVRNLNIDAHYIFLIQKSHSELYNLPMLLKAMKSNCTVIEVDGITQGAACTALLAKNYINNDSPLFFANSDQFVEWDSVEFMYKMQETDADGGIVTFQHTDSKWSFAKVDENGVVVEVAEKNPISDNATVGFYYWKRGADFVKYAEQMIENDVRVNSEFYVCPVFNEAIKDGKRIKAFSADKMWGLGTPEDLSYYINSHI